jgi:dolichyl-phosphate-mannose--protein O-mannosyl transferase
VILSIVYIIKILIAEKVISKTPVYVYLAAAAALFAIYYPVLSGLPVATRYSDALKFFTSWIW